MLKLPEISDERLEELAARIKPVVRFISRSDTDSDEYLQDPKGLLCYIEEVDPRKVAFNWAPKPTEVARGLELLTLIKTYHTWRAPSMFKASIAEVLAQIPYEHLDKVVAFEVLTYGLGPENVHEGYHETSTRLYKKKL